MDIFGTTVPDGDQVWNCVSDGRPTRDQECRQRHEPPPPGTDPLPPCSLHGLGAKPPGDPRSQGWRVTFPHLPISVPSTEHKRREAVEKEKERLQYMDEEEYDAMTEEEKIMFNREVQQALRERKKRSESRASGSGSGSPGSNTQPILVTRVTFQEDDLPRSGKHVAR